MNAFKIIQPDMDALCDRAAHDLLRVAHQSIDERGQFTIALAGGTTPKRLYQLLAKAPFSSNFPWGKTQIFFGDERHAGPDSPDSNFHMVNQALLKKVNIDPMHVHRIHGELDANEAAESYQAVLNTWVPITPDGQIEFDLVLLGLGPDGHVASLFPGTDILKETKKPVAAVWVESKKTWRISITLPVINNARNTWIFVTGESKREIIEHVFSDDQTSEPLPVQLLRPKNGLQWYLDEAAVGRAQ